MTDASDNDEKKPDQDYEIGYGRPPKESQFKPGQSGNSKGAKRKTASVQAQMQRVLSKKVAINEGGKKKLLPLQEVILRTLANKAAKGDLKAAAFVLNLLNSPEYADTDAIDQGTLSREDQALLDQMMGQLLGTTGSEEPTATGPSDVDHQVIDAASDDGVGPQCAPDPDDDDGAPGGQTDV